MTLSAALPTSASIAATMTSPLKALRSGLVIPAHPLALTEDGAIDERHHVALTRYYRAAGAGGLAVGVHTTEFEIRDPKHDLLRSTLSLTADAARDVAPGESVPVLVAGACGPTAQAVAETELAAGLGYNFVLLSPGDLAALSEDDLLERTRQVARILPVIGFYLQPAVHGRPLSERYWRDLADIEGVVAVKAAPFNRYDTLDVVHGIAASRRAEEVSFYTGNDDNIIADLLTPWDRPDSGGEPRATVGGLLGQWAVWTHSAVDTLQRVKQARAGEGAMTLELLAEGARLTRANQAIFDAANGFRGCVPGIKEVLRRQGLLRSRRCLDPNLDLSPGQAEAISDACKRYPSLIDDQFVAEHLHEWLR